MTERTIPELDDVTTYAVPTGLPRWSTCTRLVFIAFVSLGLWAVIWCGVNAFVENLAPGY